MLLLEKKRKQNEDYIDTFRNWLFPEKVKFLFTEDELNEVYSKAADIVKKLKRANNVKVSRKEMLTDKQLQHYYKILYYQIHVNDQPIREELLKRVKEYLNYRNTNHLWGHDDELMDNAFEKFEKELRASTKDDEKSLNEAIENLNAILKKEKKKNIK